MTKSITSEAIKFMEVQTDKMNRQRISQKPRNLSNKVGNKNISMSLVHDRQTDGQSKLYI